MVHIVAASVTPATLLLKLFSRPLRTGRFERSCMGLARPAAAAIVEYTARSAAAKRGCRSVLAQILVLCLGGPEAFNVSYAVGFAFGIVLGIGLEICLGTRSLLRGRRRIG